MSKCRNKISVFIKHNVADGFLKNFTKKEKKKGLWKKESVKCMNNWTKFGASKYYNPKRNIASALKIFF